MMTVAIHALLYNKNIIVVYPYSHNEISMPKIGATRLIYEQIESLKNTGHTVNLLSLEEIGSLLSFLIKFEGRIRQKGFKQKATSSSEKQRWQLNLLAVIIIEVLSRLDVWFARKLQNKLKNFKYPASIIYHYPRGFVVFSKAAKNFGATVAIYEHNIEWKFFESNVIANKFAAIASAIWKEIELNALRQADHVICASKNDFNILKEVIDHDKMDVWVPANHKYLDKPSIDIDQALKQKLGNNFVIGFVGTNFSPNIVSVRNIIDIAKKMLDSKIVFLIIGNVSQAFDNNNIPTNIIFTGYVDDLDSYLYLCDAFLNLKTTTHTGIEIKMFDYLKFDKPIIATPIGSSGFENSRNVIVVEDVTDTRRLLLWMLESKGRKK
jgi:Glycosyl transferases group 1/Glycosyltransferase Family 4